MILTIVNATTIIGFAAGILTTAGNVPQVIKTYQSRSGEGLSFKMLLTLSSGLALWIVFGIMSHSLPITLTNATGFSLIAALIAMTLRFDRDPTKD